MPDSQPDVQPDQHDDDRLLAGGYPRRWNLVDTEDSLMTAVQSIQEFTKLLEDLSGTMLRLFPWMAHLPDGDRPECARELVSAVLDGQAVEEIAQLLIEWEATARAYTDPASVNELDEPYVVPPIAHFPQASSE